ncbi:MAG: hypothetical protein IT313_05515 [Anaerolineales bacterium]|nr:hypothetical protein [Anaerolineales bacterium]
MKDKSKFAAIVSFVSVLALAALSCGVSDVSNLFATATPTATLTFTPSPTFTPSATPTSTPTPTATPQPTGVSTEKQSDGTTLFTDFDNQYQLALPADWFILPLSAEDFSDILNEMSEENPDLRNSAEAFKKLDPDVIRVVAIHKDSKYMENNFGTNLTITALQDKLLSTMPVAFVTGVMESQMEKGGATVIEQEELVLTSASGVEIGVVEFVQDAPTSTGEKIRVQSRLLVFQTGKKLIMVQLTVPQPFAKELFPILDDIAKSITLLQ